MREPARRFPRARMTVRVALMLVFVSVATLTPFAIGLPRQPITVVAAVLTSVLSLVVAGAIWWI